MGTPELIDLLHAVGEASSRWRDIDSGDSNTVDLYWHARTVREALDIAVPGALPAAKDGAALVELVEAHFIPKTGRGLLRDVPPMQIVTSALNLLRAISNTKLLAGLSAENYVAVLFAWHGCINMAKLLQPTYVAPGGESPYSAPLREEGYRWLKECWEHERSTGNAWVRYGVSVAKPFELARKKDAFGKLVNDAWVPSDSPYWSHEAVRLP